MLRIGCECPSRVQYGTLCTSNPACAAAASLSASSLAWIREGEGDRLRALGVSSQRSFRCFLIAFPTALTGRRNGVLGPVGVGTVRAAPAVDGRMFFRWGETGVASGVVEPDSDRFGERVDFILCCGEDG